MENEITENYNILLNICQSSDKNILAAYRQLRSLLERICKESIADKNLRMTDLSARINYISAKYKLSVHEQTLLHDFRIVSNSVLNHYKTPVREDLLQGAKHICRLYERISHTSMPATLSIYFLNTTEPTKTSTFKKNTSLYTRVYYKYSDEEYLYVTEIRQAQNNLLKVQYNVQDINNEFSNIRSLLWPNVKLNLIDTYTDENGILIPSFIVLEPDYLINISTLAACYKDYGSNALNYIISRFSIPGNTRALLLGNITNIFLDEWVSSKENSELSYKEVMKKVFQDYLLDILSCEDLYNKEKEHVFFKDCQSHFNNIRHIIKATFKSPEYNLNKENAILEPSFLCEKLGIQGRLDYLQCDLSSFIEMKSGKADEYSLHGKIIPKENNMVQMLLYQAILQYSMGITHQHIKPYLLYTLYPLLYPARSSWKKVRQIINLRNQIVANEHNIASNTDDSRVEVLLSKISADNLNEKKLNNHYWDFLKTEIDLFQNNLKNTPDIEKEYFYANYRFITTELYTSKTGNNESFNEEQHGYSSLWLNDLEWKKERGEILFDLTITQKDEKKITLQIDHTQCLSNFRNGDAVILYKRNTPTDNVTNQILYKASIQFICPEQLIIELRTRQHNSTLFSTTSLYAIEHDVMDTSFNGMYRGLSRFLQANSIRKQLILSQKLPESDSTYKKQIQSTKDEFERIAYKALAAKDYFLLIGPPGTGKTTHALRQMVETFYASSNHSKILLLAYTNRAVDEICKALSLIEPNIDYLRIGRELSCNELYRKHLLCNKFANLPNRSEALYEMNKIRIYVGTITSITEQDKLFKLEHFQAAIIDEASQILEPQILNILCAKNSDGNNAIDKFILIGDYKQLPAVVQQSDQQSLITDQDLIDIGIRNLNESLFERLYRFVSHHPADLRDSYDIILRQGRMNPAIALFPNTTFYAGKLKSIGLPHQCDELSLSHELHCDNLSTLMLRRISFIPAKIEPWENTFKINHSEAQIIARIAQKIYQQYHSSFSINHTLGIIAPYRSQVSLIRYYISLLNIDVLNKITVDTVERFQGSERDVIIYSFCANHLYQLPFLSNIIEEDGIKIDRKLNVVLTRARKQIFLTGRIDILQHNAIYKKLITEIPIDDIMDSHNL